MSGVRPLTRFAILYAVATVGAVVAWWTLGDAWWLQPINLATFWWTVPALPLAVVALLRRRVVATVALMLPALVWVWSYGTLFVPGSAPDQTPTLRVATFNTYVQASGVRHVADLVDRTDPDVLVLQEVFPPRERRLRERLADRYPHVAAIPSPRVGGLLVLSRYPVVRQRPIEPTATVTRHTGVVELDVDGRPVEVVPVHLLSPCRDCGPSLTARLEFEGTVRHAEMASILRALTPGVPTVIAGDFNSNERSSPYRQLTRAGFSDPHRVVGRGPGFTWPNDGSLPPLLRIDWVLTRGLVPVAAWVDDGGTSDHRPVVVDLAVAPERP